MIQLSESQQNAFNIIVEKLPEEKIILLEGSAGTGKTTLTKYIADYYQNKNICAIAPTHKSKKVINDILNKNLLLPISSFTVASALSKIKQHSYLGTQNYTDPNIKKLSSFNLFIIDEVSMINDADLKTIIKYVRNTQKQALIIGDSNQIPCPSAKFIEVEIVDECIINTLLYLI